MNKGYIMNKTHELMELEALRNLVSRIWGHTELETSSVSKRFLLKELSKISELVEDAVIRIDSVIVNVENRKVCSSCETHYACNDCLEEMYNG